MTTTPEVTTCATCDAPLRTARERAELLCARHLAGAAPTCACGEPLAPRAYSDRCRRCQKRADESRRKAAGRTCACGARIDIKSTICRPCSDARRRAA